MTRFTAPLLASLLGLASMAAHAETDVNDAARREIGTCIVVQSARLDNGTHSVEVLSRAVAAGCLARLRTVIAQDHAVHPQLSAALSLDGTSDAFDVQDVLADMAASAITWLRGPGATHVAELRGLGTVVAAR